MERSLRPGRFRRRLLALLIAFAVLESGARIVLEVFPRPERESYGYPPDLYVWNEFTEYGLRPNYAGTFTGSAYRDVSIVTNADGYRDATFESGRIEGVPRVAVLGDSVSFGAGVEASARYSDLLEVPLDGKRFEVLNLAVNSYNLFHYRQQVEHVLPRYAPDVVVIGFCLNDLEPRERCWPRELVCSRDGTHLGALTLEPPLWQRVARSFALARVAKDLLRRLEPARGPDHWRRWMEGLVDRAWKDAGLLRELRADLVRVREGVARLGARLIVVLLPERNDLEDPARYAGPRETLLRLLDELAIEPLDLHATFRERLSSLDDLYLEGDSVHFTERGHTRIAEALRARL